MFFDFFKKNKRRRTNKNTISVKPGYNKPRKGFEYEDLLAKPKRNGNKRRNSLSKIYIQDPEDSSHILVAEEIGVMYGEPWKNAPKQKETRGMQTVPVKDMRGKGPKTTPTKGKYNRIVGKGKRGKNVSFREDIRSLSFQDGPIDKDDHIIYPRKNLPKVKGKSVSFQEDGVGVRSVSSVISGSVYDQGFNPNRNENGVASQPIYREPFGKPGGNFRHKGNTQSTHPFRKSAYNNQDRRAPDANHALPPIRSKLDPGHPGEYYGRMRQTSSYPNLSQNTNPVLPHAESYPGTPLRTFDEPDAVGDKPISKGRRGWNKVRELTSRKGRPDTVIDMPSELGGKSGTPALPGLHATSTVPNVLLQSFFRNATHSTQNRRPPSQAVKKAPLPKNLTEPTSLLKGALPVLPTSMAITCLTLNVFIPGLGTMMSGWMGALWGRIRIGPEETGEHRVMAVIVTAVTGLVQLFTVTFCLVGWFWAISWGIILVSLSRRYNQFILEHRSQITRAAGLEMLGVSSSGNIEKNSRSYMKPKMDIEFLESSSERHD